MAAAGLAVAGITVVAGLAHPGSPFADEARPAPRAARPTPLEIVLLDLRSAWQPEAHRLALEAAAKDARTLVVPLRRLFGGPPHALVLQALELTGCARLEELLPDVQRLARRPGLRAPALSAADQIAPLPENELVELLTDDDPAMVRAALAMCQRRPQQPLAAMIGILAHEDDSLAGAALASLPAQLPQTCRADLMQLTVHERQEVATRAWQALLRIGDAAAESGDEAPPAVDPDAADRGSQESGSADGAAAGSADAARETIDAIGLRPDSAYDGSDLDAIEKLAPVAEPQDGARITVLMRSTTSNAVRKEACLILGRLRHDGAVRDMIDLLRDSTDAGLRANVLWSLQAITREKLRGDAEVWENWWQLVGQHHYPPTPPPTPPSAPSPAPPPAEPPGSGR